MPKLSFTMHDKLILGSHLVRVTLHGQRFTISIWERQIELVTLNTSFILV